MIVGDDGLVGPFSMDVIAVTSASVVVRDRKYTDYQVRLPLSQVHPVEQDHISLQILTFRCPLWLAEIKELLLEREALV